MKSGTWLQYFEGDEFLVEKSSLCKGIFCLLFCAEGEQDESPGLLHWGPNLELILLQSARGVWTCQRSAVPVAPASKDNDLVAIVSLLQHHLLPVWGFQLQTPGTVRTACLMEKQKYSPAGTSESVCLYEVVPTTAVAAQDASEPWDVVSRQLIQYVGLIHELK